ncbi:hypothetical protein EON78_03150 [bacterium]|nr:MAG: hypothetical protein EON78_03150 [bacterium]
MSNDIRVSNPGASTLYDALVFKSEKANVAEQEPQVQDETYIETEDSTQTNEPQRGSVPASDFNFDEPIVEQDPSEELPSLDEGLPQIDENQQYDPQMEAQQQQEFDPNDLPALNEPNQFPNETNPEDYKGETSKNHSISKAVAHFESGLVRNGITKMAQSYIKGAATKAVTKELTEVLAKGITVGTTKKGIDVAAKVTAGAAKGLEKGVVELTAKGLLGKGVATVGVKEGALAAGNLVKGLEASAKASSEILLKGGAKKILPNTAQALARTSVGAGEKILQKGIQEGTDIAVKAVIKNLAEESAGKVLTEVVAKTAAKSTAKTAAKAGGKAATETAVKVGTKVAVKAGAKTTSKAGAKAATSAVEKLTAEAVTKATTEVATKGGVKIATKVGKAMPWIGAAVGAGITVWDAVDAVEKTKDAKASTASKVLAWTTVGLDIVSTATTATGKGAPIGWAATGLGIGTSILSDYVR